MSKVYQGHHPQWGLRAIGTSREEVIGKIGCEESELVFTEIEKSDFILREVPEEFKFVLNGMAYDRGHYAGEEECELILEGLVNDLLPAIKDFQARIIAKVLQTARDYV